MITRDVTLKLKANPVLEFINLKEKQIIELLRKKDGLREAAPMVAPKLLKAGVSSSWKGHYYVSSR